MRGLFAVTMAFALMTGCSGQDDVTEAADTTEGASETEVASGTPTSTTERPIVMLETDSGTVVLEFFPDAAPITCDSILSLVNQGFYDGLIFHRIMPGFVVQGGDPQGTGRGNAGFTIPAEFSTRQHLEGTLSMARAPNDINSSSCQFFICLAKLANLDGQYNIFGQVVTGMDVVHKLSSVPTSMPGNRPIEPVTILRMYENK
jgi:peptidyl-prolyl cis-trans isomerase B (cyclophilin B)